MDASCPLHSVHEEEMREQTRKIKEVLQDWGGGFMVMNQLCEWWFTVYVLCCTCGMYLCVLHVYARFCVRCVCAI